MITKLDLEMMFHKETGLVSSIRFAKTLGSIHKKEFKKWCIRKLIEELNKPK